MQSKVVSFRLPVKEYALLLADAAEKNMALSDFVITKIYKDPPPSTSSTPPASKLDFDLQLEFVKLAYQIVRLTSQSSNNFVRFEENYLKTINRYLAQFDPSYIHTVRIELNKSKVEKK